jgi:hypothetical protein
MSEICAAAEYLREGGPRTVPFRVCCVAAILRAEHDAAATRRAAADSAASTVRAEGGDPFLCAAMDLTIPADAASIVAEAGVGQPT